MSHQLQICNNKEKVKSKTLHFFFFVLSLLPFPFGALLQKGFHLVKKVQFSFNELKIEKHLTTPQGNLFCANLLLTLGRTLVLTFIPYITYILTSIPMTFFALCK